MPGVGAYLDALDAAWAQRADQESSTTACVDVAGWRLQIDGAPGTIADAVAGAFDRTLGGRDGADLHVRVAAGAPQFPREPD